MYNNCSKIKTYLGFAKRARKIVYGVDDIIKLKNFNCLILSSSNLAESSFDKLNKIAEKNNSIPLMTAILGTKERIFNVNVDCICRMALIDTKVVFDYCRKFNNTLIVEKIHTSY